MKRANYARSFRRWIEKTGEDMLSLTYSNLGINLPVVLKHLDMSQKFIFPDGGCIIDASAIKTLDKPELVHLPFPITAIEYKATPKEGRYEKHELVTCLSRILLVTEHDGNINLRGIWRFDGNGNWMVTPCLRLNADGINKIARAGDEYLKHGKWVVEESVYEPLVFDHKPPFNGVSQDQFVSSMRRDLEEEWSVVLRLMAVLSCSNVSTESLPVPRVHSNKKGELRYDSYHYLSIGNKGNRECSSSSGSGRSPRERLRRGHIRCLQDGRKIWINAAVVNAGVGGKVEKEYALA